MTMLAQQLKALIFCLFVLCVCVCVVLCCVYMHAYVRVL